MTTKIKYETEYTQEELAEAFPEVEPGFEPFGTRLVVQIRSAKKKSKGGIILTEDSKDSEKWNTQVAKVIKIGPIAFKNRDTLEPWHEGEWCGVGDFVRVPKYLQDRWEVADNNGNQVLFMIVNDIDLLAKLTCNPLQIKAYI